MDIIVGIGDCIVSSIKGSRIKTFALASCVAVTAYSPSKGVSGMVHVALPSPSESSDVLKPAYYATTGIPLLIQKVCKEYRCNKDELVIQIYGGANSINKKDIFNIGRKNIEAVKGILSSLSIRVQKEVTGGTVSRTIEMDVSSGNITMSTLPINI